MTTEIVVRPPEAVEGEVITGGMFVEDNPFKPGRMRWLDVAEGSALDAYYEAALATLAPAYAPHIELWIDEQRMDRAYWRNVRPKPGHTVYARVRPYSGKTGKNILRAALMIAVIVAATYFLGPAAFQAGGWLGLSMSAGAATAVSAAAIAVTTTIGMMAINALIPAPGLTNTQLKPKPTLTGGQNQFAPYASVPRVFGKLRVYPLFGGYPYTENVGNDQYLRVLLVVGWGPLKISDIRIGDTPIANYTNVEVEINEGGPAGWTSASGSNVPITLYNRKVTEVNLSAALTAAGGASAPQTTALNTVEVTVDLTFPAGLCDIDKSGNHIGVNRSFKVEYRTTSPQGAWLAAPLTSADDNTSTSGGNFTVFGGTQDAVRSSVRFKTAAGQYDVRVTRTSADSATGSSTQHLDVSYWTTLRSFSTDSPVNQTGVCTIALRMKATEQLNGTPGTINCLAEAYLPVYSGGTWTYQITRNPAWAYADVLRRRGGATFIADSRIDYAGSIAAWAADCDATASNAAEPKWTFDGVIQGGTVFDALRTIAANGRAGYTMRDAKFAVVQDKSQATPVQIITPKNSWNYSASRTYLQQPDAYRVQFQNADLQYKQDEVIVYATGKDASNASIFETLPLVGCTSKTQAWREGKYHMAVASLRPEEHRVNMDIEGLRCTRGDRVELSYDAMSVGQSWGRITGLTTSAGNTTAFLVDENCVFATGTSYQLRVRHANGSTSIRTVTMTAGPGTTRTLNCTAEATSGGPQVGDMYVFGQTALVTAPMIIKRVEPADEMSVTLTMTNYDEGIYTSDTGTIPAFTSFIGTDPATTKPLSPIVAIRADFTSHVITAGVGILPQIAADIVNPSDRITVAGNEIQWRLATSSMWSDYGGYLYRPNTTAYVGGVQNGATYQVRIRAKGYNGLYSDWVQPANITVTNGTLVPNPPTSPAASSAYHEIDLVWTNPGDADFAGVEVWASQTNSQASSALLGTTKTGSFQHTGIAGGVLWYYWLRSVDTTGNHSSYVQVDANGTMADEAPSGDNIVPDPNFYGGSGSSFGSYWTTSGGGGGTLVDRADIRAL